MLPLNNSTLLQLGSVHLVAIGAMFEVLWSWQFPGQSAVVVWLPFSDTGHDVAQELPVGTFFANFPNLGCAARDCE